MQANLSITFTLTDDDVKRIQDAIALMSDIKKQINKVGIDCSNDIDALDEAIMVLNYIADGQAL